jgi:tubulin polyglutamylase TTLL6/13
VAEEMGWRISKDQDWTKGDWDLWWNDLGIDSYFLTQAKSYQKVNHFPAMYQIARKTYLAKNLRRLQKLYPQDFTFFPKTWCLPLDLPELKTS